MHEARIRRHGDPEVNLRAHAAECAVLDCRAPYAVRGLCNRHYLRWRKNGHTAEASKSDRFWLYVTESAGCWLWAGALNPAGYGLFRGYGRTVLAHRWAYQELIDDVPAGLQLDHLCRVRRCVNPWHLDPVPAAVNTARAVAARA